MSESLAVDLFVEDRAHEEFLKPLLMRIAQDEHITVWVRVRSATGGHARAIAEFKLYQRVMSRSPLSSAEAGLIIVAIDGNCSTFAAARRQLHDAADPTLQDRLVIACPDPHVERWYLADPQSFENVVGSRPDVGTGKCARGHYKQALATAIAKGGHPRHPWRRGIRPGPGGGDGSLPGREERCLAESFDRRLPRQVATVDSTVGITGYATVLARGPAVQHVAERQQRRGLAGLPRRMQYEVLLAPDEAKHVVKIDPLQRRDVVVVRGHDRPLGIEREHWPHRRRESHGCHPCEAVWRSRRSRCRWAIYESLPGA